MKSSQKVLGLIVVAALTGLTVTACSTDGGAPAAQNSTGSTQVTTAASNLPAVTGDQGKAPTIAAPTGSAPTTLVTKDIYVGTGAAAVATSTLTVQYTLMAWSTGKVVESSWTSQAATFPLSGVIPGWQQGIPGMKVGGRRLLLIPPALGYGATGSGPIGPNETLIFVVDVLAIK
ncbi:MAG: FKBP-type peptidyl-prolyl cis-trans isomerase [Actinomycetes bacterium]